MAMRYNAGASTATNGVNAMIDTYTGKPIRVSADGTAGPYIMVRVDQLEHIRKILLANDIPHWVDDNAISLDGKPAVVVINLSRGSNPSHVQEVLDQAA